MVSKCANPECSERFLYLHQGKLFHLTPTPEVEALRRECALPLYERFWLCDRCAKKMTLVWGGTEAKLVRVPAATVGQASGSGAKTEITASTEAPRHTVGHRR